jgi:HlyD family secretion protein
MVTTPTPTVSPVSPPGPLQASFAAERKARRLRGRQLRRWSKRVLLGLAGIGIVAAGVYAWLPDPIPVDVDVVDRGPLEITVDEDGRTRVRDRFVVSAPVGGELARIELEPGAIVERDSVLARILPPSPIVLDERTRSETRARLAGAIARQRRADTAVARTRAAQATATRELERSRALIARRVISQSEHERSELAAQLAELDRTAAVLEREAATADVRGLRAMLAPASASRAIATPVLAPASGRVLRVLRDDAGPVAAGTPLVELGDPGRVEVVVDVLSSDAARIQVGAAVTVDGWGGEQRLTGRVRLVEPAAVTRISALGIEEQRVDVIVDLDDVPAALGDGYRVEAQIVVWRGDDVVTVPTGALFRDHGRWAVYAVDGTRARLRPVEVGQRATLEAEVRGLAPGTRVIVHPGDQVADGVEVAPR